MDEKLDGLLNARTFDACVLIVRTLKKIEAYTHNRKTVNIRIDSPGMEGKSVFHIHYEPLL